MSERLLIIGEDYGDSVDNEYCVETLALTGQSGQRLASLMGVDLLTFVEQTDRTNIVTRPADWKDRGAVIIGAARVAKMMRGRRVLLLGHKVSDVLGLHPTLFTWTEGPGCVYAVLPHTSGRNRFYNSEENVEIARQFLRGEVVGR
jgi:uracil-DNA glycosylase